MTDAQRDAGKSSARLRLVASNKAKAPADPSQDEQSQLESEMALERRQMRRDLAAKLHDEHLKKLATTDAPRSALGARQVESRTGGRAQASATLEVVDAGARQDRVTHLAPRESPVPFRAALVVGGLLVAGYLVWDNLIDPATSATAQLRRALVAIPFVWAGAIMAALVSLVVLRPTERQRAANAEIDQLELELEMALERRTMRRALASMLVDDYRNAPGRVAARALRAALVNRDLTEEECAALDRSLSKARNRSRDGG